MTAAVRVDGPELLVLGVDGLPHDPPRVALDRDDGPVSIGRHRSNDIVLVPDPNKVVSRSHCLIEPYLKHHWRLRDLNSERGCYLEFPSLSDRHAGGRERIASGETADLSDGHAICIPAEPPGDDGEPLRCWRLLFTDPAETHLDLTRIWLVGYSDSETVYVCRPMVPPHLVEVSGHAHQMLWFLLHRYRERGAPRAGVLAHHEELAEHLWPADRAPRSTSHLANVVQRLRAGLLDVDQRLLRSEPGVGYRLVPRP